MLVSSPWEARGGLKSRWWGVLPSSRTPKRTSEWKGFEVYDFGLEGGLLLVCVLIVGALYLKIQHIVEVRKENKHLN